jgi:hypothetical protein
VWYAPHRSNPAGRFVAGKPSADRPAKTDAKTPPAFNENRIQTRDDGGRYAPRQTFSPTKPRMVAAQPKKTA